MDYAFGLFLGYTFSLLFNGYMTTKALLKHNNNPYVSYVGGLLYPLIWLWLMKEGLKRYLDDTI